MARVFLAHVGILNSQDFQPSTWNFGISACASDAIRWISFTTSLYQWPCPRFFLLLFLACIRAIDHATYTDSLSPSPTSRVPD